MSTASTCSPCSFSSLLELISLLIVPKKPDYSTISSPSPSSFFSDFLFDDNVMKKEVMCITVVLLLFLILLFSFSPLIFHVDNARSSRFVLDHLLTFLNNYIAAKMSERQQLSFPFQPFCTYMHI